MTSSKPSHLNKINIDQIYATLKKRIIDSKYQSGEKLSENHLASELNISRTPIRQVFHRLSEEGLVKIIPKSGTYVSEFENDRFEELLCLRNHLDCLALRLATQYAEPNDIKKLRNIFDEYKDAIKNHTKNIKKRSKLHFNFHLQIVKMSQNRQLLKIYKTLGFPVEQSQATEFSEVQEESVRSHEKLIEFIENKDSTGEEWLKKHYEKIARVP